jgi:hypothetical protein
MASSKTNRYEYIVVALILQIRYKNFDGLQSETGCYVVGCLFTVIENGNSDNGMQNIKFTPEIVS